MKRENVPFAAFLTWVVLGTIAALSHQLVIAWSAIVCASVWSAAGFVADGNAGTPTTPPQANNQ